MDPNSGKFIPETESTPADWVRFTVGENVEIKGVTMVVSRVLEDRIILRPTGQPEKNPYSDHPNRHERRAYGKR